MSTTSHAFVLRAGTDSARPPLVLLHGSDGTERDLLPLAEDVAPGAPRLGVRGTVTMEGGYGFFRRFRDRSIDGADLTARIPVLAQFVRETCSHRWPGRRPLVLGYSNGAIMGAALLMADPPLLAGAILLRPLRPPMNAPELRIDGFPVLIIDGEHDERRSPGDGLALADQLRRLGADVTHRVLATGHALIDADRMMVREWLRR
jgi:phospholipase/carboxylesterase